MIVRTPKTFDVCIIGSGAAGGFMAKELCEAGADTVLLEAGGLVTNAELTTRRWPFEFPERLSFAERCGAFYPDDIAGAIEYRGAAIEVDRIRTLGGRTARWNGVCFRFSPDDFRERSLHGLEEDWPLSYEELAPFYSYVEKQIGLCGTREGLEVVPDGEYFAPPPNLRCSEVIARNACNKLGIRLIPTRKALAIQPFKDRPACHHCGNCMSGCDIGAIFTSGNTLVPAALATGKLTLRCNALARKVLVDADGRASAVSFIDRQTGREEEVRARIVVVSCSTVESARLLLNSACERFPNGLANSNDLVGRYLHGNSVASFFGYLEDLAGTTPVNNDGATDHSYIPRFNQRRQTGDYVGGFGIQLQAASQMYPYHAHRLQGFGAKFKHEVKRLFPALLQMNAYGKVLARRENRVLVDPDRSDAFGIPVPVVQFEFDDNDRALFRDMVASVEEIYHTAGVELLFRPSNEIFGLGSHEVGTCRMGRSRKTSVLNSFCQSHEVANLFVVDGSCMVTLPEKNLTLSIMALAVRSARYIVAQNKRRNL